MPRKFERDRRGEVRRCVGHRVLVRVYDLLILARETLAEISGRSVRAFGSNEPGLFHISRFTASAYWNVRFGVVVARGRNGHAVFTLAHDFGRIHGFEMVSHVLHFLFVRLCVLHAGFGVLLFRGQ